MLSTNITDLKARESRTKPQQIALLKFRMKVTDLMENSRRKTSTTDFLNFTLGTITEK